MTVRIITAESVELPEATCLSWLTSSTFLGGKRCPWGLTSGDGVTESGFLPGVQGVLRPLFYVCTVLFWPLVVKNLPALQTRVPSLGWEDPLEKRMAIHSSILAWTIPWTEKPSRLQSTGVAKSQTRLSDFTLHSWSYRWRAESILIYKESHYYIISNEGSMLSKNMSAIL